MQVPPPELLAFAAAPPPPANESQSYPLPNSCEDPDSTWENSDEDTLAQAAALDQLHLAEHLTVGSDATKTCLSGRVVLAGHSFGGGASMLAMVALSSDANRSLDVAGLLLLSPGTYTDPPVLPALKDFQTSHERLPPVISFIGGPDTDLNSACSSRLLSLLNTSSTCMKLVIGAPLGHCEWADTGCKGGRFPGTPGLPPDENVLAKFRSSAIPLMAASLQSFFNASAAMGVSCDDAGFLGHVGSASSAYTWTYNISASCRCNVNASLPKGSANFVSKGHGAASLCNHLLKILAIFTAVLALMS